MKKTVYGSQRVKSLKYFDDEFKCEVCECKLFHSIHGRFVESAIRGTVQQNDV